MDEYINRELALKAKVPHYSANGVEIIMSEAIPVEYIENLPAADVRPVVRGKWIECGDNQPTSNDKVYCCSNCKGNRRFGWQLKPFCSNCGADMRELPKEE